MSINAKDIDRQLALVKKQWKAAQDPTKFSLRYITTIFYFKLFMVVKKSVLQCSTFSKYLN